MSDRTLTAREIASALMVGGKEPKKDNQGNYATFCPIHRDKEPSLDVAEKGGKIVAICRAGCDQMDVWRALQDRKLVPNGVRTPLGLTVAEYAAAKGLPEGFLRGPGVGLYDDTLPAKGDLPEVKVVAIPYRKADGSDGPLRYRLTMIKGHHDRRFLWRRGSKTTLYGLWRLAEAREAGYVILAEGESDCHTLWFNGLPAIGAPGAGNWNDERDAAHLDGIDRIYVIDEGGAAGENMVAKLAGSRLRDRARVVRLGTAKDPSELFKADQRGFLLKMRAALDAAVEPPPPVVVAARPTIRIVGGELHTMVAAAAEAIGEATRADPLSGYYRRDRYLVHVIRLADKRELEREGVRRARGALVIEVADPDALRLALTELRRWEKWDARSEDWVAKDAPGDVAVALAKTAAGRSVIPILTGIIEAPTLRADGTVLDRPGYDPATGLLFDPGGVAFPAVPESPTREQALAALEKLKELVVGFPFVDEASRAVAIAGILAPLVRRACRSVPLHGLTAPKMGTGKTLLCMLPGYIATGRQPAIMTQAERPEEEKKRMFAIFLEGLSIVVIDNVERDLKSDALCTALTSEEVSDRVLGASRNAMPPTDATVFFVNGNNLRLAGDLTSRAILCALDPECEHPEERSFDVDLHRTVPERRAELAVAALTVVRAYIVAGRPKVDLPVFGRFEDWDRFVRRPLVWLGMADPCQGRERIEGSDPVRARLGALLRAWHAVFGATSATVSAAIDCVSRERYHDERADHEEARRALGATLLEVSGGIRVNGRVVGSLPSWPLKVWEDGHTGHEICPPSKDRKKLAGRPPTRARPRARTRGA